MFCHALVSCRTLRVLVLKLVPTWVIRFHKGCSIWICYPDFETYDINPQNLKPATHGYFTDHLIPNTRRGLCCDRFNADYRPTTWVQVVTKQHSLIRSSSDLWGRSLISIGSCNKCCSQANCVGTNSPTPLLWFPSLGSWQCYCWCSVCYKCSWRPYSSSGSVLSSSAWMQCFPYCHFH